jgi:hypothetical protein
MRRVAISCNQLIHQTMPRLLRKNWRAARGVDARKPDLCYRNSGLPLRTGLNMRPRLCFVRFVGRFRFDSGWMGSWGRVKDLTISLAVKTTTLLVRSISLKNISKPDGRGSAFSGSMTIASANSRVLRAGLDVRPFVGIVVASIALAAGISPAAAAGSLEVRSAYTLIPAQLSMDRKTPPNAPAPKKSMSARTGRDVGLTPEEQRRLAEAINRMTPKERKRLDKMMKRLTPEGRRQLADVVKRQLAERTS